MGTNVDQKQINKEMEALKADLASSMRGRSANTNQSQAQKNDAVESLTADLTSLMRGRPSMQDPSDSLIIAVRSEYDRCKIQMKKPVKLPELEATLARRYGMRCNIYHSNPSYDYLQKITNQNEMDNLVRLHEMRNGERKFRITISKREETENGTSVDINNDFRGLFDINAFVSDLASEASTSARTVMSSGRINLGMLPEIPERRPPEQVHIGRIIGTGAHGIVRLCNDSRTGEMLVVKKVHARGDANAIKKKMDNLSDEVGLLSRLSHENIVQYRGAVIGQDVVLIFMEHMTGGSVYDWIHDSGPFLPIQTIYATRQVLAGLQYLHNLGVVHRDIKTSNIMRTSQMPVTYKIGDFGSAQLLRALASFSADYQGTPHYTAPEIFRKRHSYNEKADIWSVGISIIEMLTGRTPYADYEATVLCVKIAEDENVEYTLPEGTPKALADVVASMLRRDPRARPKASELLALDIFSNKNVKK